MKLLIVLFTLALVLLFNVRSIASEEKSNPSTLKPDLSQQNTPHSPVLTEPSFASMISGNTVELKWAPVQDAESYHVQVASDLNFKWIVAEQNLFTNSTFTVSNLESGKSYFWRVASIKSSNMNQFTKSPFKVSKFEVK